MPLTVLPLITPLLTLTEVDCCPKKRRGDAKVEATNSEATDANNIFAIGCQSQAE
jgi:hypothetical protein